MSHAEIRSDDDETRCMVLYSLHEVLFHGAGRGLFHGAGRGSLNIVLKMAVQARAASFLSWCQVAKCEF